MKNNASLQGVHSQGENTEKASEQIIAMKCHKCFDKVLYRAETEGKMKEVAGIRKSWTFPMY